MNKWLSLVGAALIGGALLIGGCGSSSSDNSAAASNGEVTLTVGATPVPHAEILNHIKPILAKEGVNLKVIEFTDYVKPNMALNDKEIDANFFQHKPYLDKFAKEHNENLVSVAKVHVEPMGVYSKKVKSLKDLKDGAIVAIPNDPTNGGRALLLLQKEGLITLKDPKNITATAADIKDNPKHIQIKELDAAQLPRTLQDVDAAVINTNFALDAGLNPLKDALAIEDKDSPYANILVVRAGDENKPAIKKLIAALHSQDVKTFIEQKYKGAIIPAF